MSKKNRIKGSKNLVGYLINLDGEVLSHDDSICHGDVLYLCWLETVENVMKSIYVENSTSKLLEPPLSKDNIDDCQILTILDDGPSIAISIFLSFINLTLLYKTGSQIGKVELEVINKCQIGTQTKNLLKISFDNESRIYFCPV